MSDIKILGPDIGYVEMLNYYTQQVIVDKDKTFTKYSPLRPSSAGKCEMELGYEWMEFKGYTTYPKTPNTPETHRLLNFGYHVENHVINEFKDAFKKSATPVDIRYRQQTLSFFKLPDGTRVEGNIDLVLVSEKFKCVADIKSKKDKFSAYYKTDWDDLTNKLTEMKSVHRFGEDSYWVEDLSQFIAELDDPFFAANFYQLNLYFFDDHQFLREKGVDHAAIFQLNKNDSRMREIRFKPSQEVFDRTQTKFSRVQELVDRDKSTESLTKDYVLGSVKCAFCRFNKECHPEMNPLKDYFKTLPPKRWPKDLDRLPQEVQPTLIDLFKKFNELELNGETLEKIEQEILLQLDKQKVYKIRLPDQTVYEVKSYKTGGVKNGPRKALKRSKV